MELIFERVNYNTHRLIVNQVFQEKGINVWKSKIYKHRIIVKQVHEKGINIWKS